MTAEHSVRVILPAHLRTLARIADTEVVVSLPDDKAVSLEAVFDAVEARYRVLGGTFREHGTKKRRPYIRYFACGTDLSHDPVTNPLPQAVADGSEPLMVIGAIAGG